MAEHHHVVEKSVSLNNYNYRLASEDMSTTKDITVDDATYGEAYHYADNYRTQGNHYDRLPEVESGAFYARLRHERYLNGQTQLTGFTSSPILTLGKVLTVIESMSVPDVFTQGVVITNITCSARRDKDFEVQFSAQPDNANVCFRPNLVARPKIIGTLSARITSTQKNDIYGHIDRDGRYRVKMMFDRDTWDQGYESLLVRQSRLYGGDTYGLHLPLLAGTEVAIAFEDGNPDRPYIGDVFHDSTHPDHVNIRNYKRNVLRTPSNNKIRLDDNRGQEHIKISTEYGGKSQLNLGHLVDSERKKRGEGFELRTDERGSIRANKGLFITADGQARAQGQMLDMQPALSHLTQARNQMQDISDSAETAAANPADLQAQIDLLEKEIADLTQSVILMSAPDGIGITSGQHTQLSAAENLIATAGHNANVSATKNFFLGVGHRLSVFVRKMGIKLIANQGAVTIQAQNDLMALMARHSIRIVSTEDAIHIVANKKLTLNGGGSYMQLDAHAIKLATAGSYTINANRYERGSSGKVTPTGQSVSPITASSHEAMLNAGAIMMEICNCGQGDTCKIHA